MMSDFARRARALFARLTGFRRQDEVARRYEEETRYHIDRQTEHYIAAGLSAAGARHAALVAFGGRARFAEEALDEVRSRGLDELERDVRLSLRALRRNPAFAAAAIITLALGIGATTVMYSLTDHVVLRPLAYPQPGRLLLVGEVIGEFRDQLPILRANASHFLEWQRRCTACADLAALLPVELTLRGSGDPIRVPASRASASLLPMLGAHARLGRLFTAAEDVDGAERVVVLADGFWRRQFGARPDVVGKTIDLDGLPRTVIGVLEPDFRLPTVCVNLANLLLARNAARLRESAVRVALGAGRGRLVRQALTESVVLALAGGLLGMLLSRWGLMTLLHFAPVTLPRLNEVMLDGRVLAVSLAVTIVAGLTFGVLPAFRFGHSDPAAVLKAQGGGRGATEDRHALHVRDVLVGTQVALSALLLVTTGLLLGSFERVLRVDKGFSGDRALALNVTLPSNDFPARAARAQLFDAVIARLRAIPSVTAAAVATLLPLEGDIQVDGLSLEHDTRPNGARPTGSIRYVSPSYFEAVGTPVRLGRGFTDVDRTRPVVVLSAHAAAAMWPGQDPIGKRLWPGSNDTLSEVVGVVDDIRTASLEKEGMPIAYVPYWQDPPVTATLILRTKLDPAQVAGSARAALRALAPSVPVSRVRTLSNVISAALAPRRFQLLVLALFAATALVTASVGIYGVVAHSLSRRTTEIGVRLALGARPAEVQGLVLRQGLTPVVIGLAAGIAGSLLLGGSLRALLYDVSPSDPATTGTVALVLVAVAAVACWLPARRATKMDLVQALRAD